MFSFTDMKGVESPLSDHRHDVRACDASDVLNSTEVVGDDQELSGYVQDNFDFLDQMDCSVLDCSISYQVCAVCRQIRVRLCDLI